MSDNLGRKILLGLGLSVALVASTAVAYVLLKDDDEDPEIIRRIKRESTSKGGRMPYKTERVFLRSDVIPAVIGKGGEVVRSIERETSTRINFEHDTTDDGAKVAVIKGTPDAVNEAKVTIERIVAKQPVLFTDEFMIPESTVGRVIGKNGSVVISLSKVTGARIDVSIL